MDIKTYTRQKLFEYYDKYGLKVTIDAGRQLLSKRIEVGKESRTSINGEIAETILELILTQYCKDNPKKTKDWCWGKSLILKDPTKDSDFLTELDFTLFTPECVYIFECKSYVGDKVIREKGLIERAGHKDFDVFKQNFIHLETLNKWIEKLSESPIYQMVLFNFSKGNVCDIRTDKYKEYLPCVDESNVLSVLYNSKPVWDMNSLNRVMTILKNSSDNLRPKHLEYVKRLHGGY